MSNYLVTYLSILTYLHTYSFFSSLPFPRRRRRGRVVAGAAAAAHNVRGLVAGPFFQRRVVRRLPLA